MGKTTPPAAAVGCAAVKPNDDDDNSTVCWDEAHEWRRCIEGQLLSATLDRECAATKNVFDVCVQGWRTVVGPSVQVKGERPGHPPPQCQSHSCLVEKCLKVTTYDFDKCEPPMRYFKHCVKGLYGSEYVV